MHNLFKPTPQGHRISGLGLFLLALCLWAVPAGAAQKSYHWSPRPENLKGLDGIVTRCVVSTDKNFVHDICRNLLNAAQRKVWAAGLKYGSAGITWERNPMQPYRAAVAGAGIAKPLMLEFFIRGTSARPVSGSVHVLASVGYRAAVEAGGNETPRSGRLLVWETAILGDGDTAKLVAALSGTITQRLDWLLGAFGK